MTPLKLPKPVRKKKTPRPLKRSAIKRKAPTSRRIDANAPPLVRGKPKPKRGTDIASRAVFKVWDDPRKPRMRKYADDEVWGMAREKRVARLMNRTNAEVAMDDLLVDLYHRHGFEQEYAILNGDRFVLLDFYLPGRKTAFEIDGSVHDRQTRYDAGRDKWLLEKHGIKVIRFRNADILKRPEAVRARVMEALNG